MRCGLIRNNRILFLEWADRLDQDIVWTRSLLSQIYENTKGFTDYFVVLYGAPSVQVATFSYANLVSRRGLLFRHLLMFCQ